MTNEALFAEVLRSLSCALAALREAYLFKVAMQPKDRPSNRETGLIKALSEKFGPPPPGVVLGIGDDCAAVSLNGPDLLLWTVDTLLEGVHFDLSFASYEQLGWKALAVNLSDIAAMGGEPRHALLSLGWPPEWDPDLALELADGLARAAREYGVAIIGGDTVASPGRLTITITLTGSVPTRQMLRRAGAREGDLIYVTDDLGEAAAGLEILRRHPELDEDLKAALTAAHLSPRPQLAAGRLLAAGGLATAAIDLSDGVASDLYHICRASGVGAVIPAAAVPISPRVLAAAPYLQADPLKLALIGGEDYQLLFTSSREMAARLAPAFAGAGLPPPLLLGEIVAGDRVSLVNGGGEVDISGAGFDHFRLDLEEEAN
jgi:thiamine-monophosphate kinase